MRSVPYEKPAPVGTGAGLTEANHRAPSSPEDRRPAISELPFALHYAAERAADFAETVFDMAREAEGLDWASRVQVRCDASLDRLVRCLPPGIPDAARAEAARMLCYV